jgi:S-DNA-T family DNA segregation ATPase FtsK/SpoIIIE
VCSSDLAEIDLPIAMGKTISNENFIIDLTKMPHLLLGSAEEQGKSLCVNSILLSLLYKKKPSEIKFVFIDTKKLELMEYEKVLKHFLAKLPNSTKAIISDINDVVNTLNSLCLEMDERYELLKKEQVRNIKEYNTHVNEQNHIPYIVVVIDEFADLIMTEEIGFEMPLARLAQLARPTGIHLIIATQRPSVNIITGMVKANFASRIAFRTKSYIDSRTILDSNGADTLTGDGDALFSNGYEIFRYQSACPEATEIRKICDFIASQNITSEPYLLPAITE